MGQPLTFSNLFETQVVAVIPVFVNISFLLGEPLPCNPEAETALQPLIWHSEGLSFQLKYFLEECAFHSHRFLDATHAAHTILYHNVKNVIL